MSGSIFHAHNEANTLGKRNKLHLIGFSLAQTEANTSEGRATSPLPKILGTYALSIYVEENLMHMHLHSVCGGTTYLL